MNTTPESTEALDPTVPEPVSSDNGNDNDNDNDNGSDNDNDTALDAVAPAGPAEPEPERTDLADVESDGAQEGATESTPAAGSEAEEPSSSRQAERTEELVREGEIAADFLEALLDIADLSGDLEVDIDGNRAAVAIVDSEDGAAPRRLVGPGGQVLDALQELTRLAVQAESGERSRLMLDVAGYRADRRAALVTSARATIAEVQQSGQRRELEPMTAFERKVVHDEVLAAGLHSESEGVEPSRFVVILPSA